VVGFSGFRVSFAQFMPQIRYFLRGPADPEIGSLRLTAQALGLVPHIQVSRVRKTDWQAGFRCELLVELAFFSYRS
jgi:hypothetical protein